jgi:TolB-like protein/DNA-binding winged helix-turn-helix (wHTH) protein/Tfp pilus assembly protein PilF
VDTLASADVLLFEGFRFDRAGGFLTRSDGPGTAEPIALGSRALALLGLLLERQGQLVTKDEIFAVVWPGTVVEEANLTVQVSALRRVLDRDREQGSCIQTIPGRGYRFIPAVTRVEAVRGPIPRFDNGSSGPSITDGEVTPPSTTRRTDDASFMHTQRARRWPRHAVIAAAAAALCLIAAAVGSVYWRSLSPWEVRSRPRLSIVVLPFQNLSDDPDQQHLADGVTEDLTTDLSEIEHMFVIAHTSAVTYRDKPISASEIGQELGVRYILEGSVQRAGDRVRINVQLIDTETAGHIWADQFEADNQNVAAAQREITGRLARTLSLKLDEDVARRIEQEMATDPDAQDLVMLGEVWFRRWLRSTGREPTQSLQEAQRYFEQALVKDPRSIDARFGIARVLINKLIFGWSTSTQEDAARAERLLLTAIETDPNRSEVYGYFGLLLRLQNRLIESRAALETALAIHPNDAWARLQMGWTLLFLGQPDAGLAEGEEALRRRPHDPEMRGVYQQLAWCLLLLDRAQPAIDMLTNALAGRPGQWVNHFALAAALGLKGDLDGAREALAKSLAIKPDVNSLARFRALRPWGNAQHWALFEKTAAAGLRRVGFPDE